MWFPLCVVRDPWAPIDVSVVSGVDFSSGESSGNFGTCPLCLFNFDTLLGVGLIGSMFGLLYVFWWTCL